MRIHSTKSNPACGTKKPAHSAVPNEGFAVYKADVRAGVLCLDEDTRHRVCYLYSPRRLLLLRSHYKLLHSLSRACACACVRAYVPA